MADGAGAAPLPPEPPVAVATAVAAIPGMVCMPPPATALPAATTPPSKAASLALRFMSATFPVVSEAYANRLDAKDGQFGRLSDRHHKPIDTKPFMARTILFPPASPCQ
jgi:hypothetical protein